MEPLLMVRPNDRIHTAAKPLSRWLRVLSCCAMLMAAKVFGQLPQVQLGLEQSADKVQVLLRPDQNFNGALTGSTVTIRWATTAGVALNTAAAAFNNPAYATTVGTLFHEGTFQQGGFSHAVFTTVYGGSPLPAPWVANTNVPFFNLPFTNTTGACVNFEVINSTWQEDNNYQWFISLNAQDRTNGYIPGSASFCASSVGVQLGIQQSADKVQVLLRPDQNFNGALTGSTVTIRWATTAGVALNTAAAAFNNPAYATTVGTLFHEGTFQQGGFSHAVFTTVYGGSPLPAPWVANTDVPFFNLPFTNTTGACINFEVINSTWQEDNNYQWFISLNAQDRTNGYIPGSTSFCAPSIGVQLGIQQSGDKVQVLLRPDQNFNGALTGSTVTIRWATTAGVALNTAAAAFNNPAYATTVGTLFHEGTFQQGGFSHAVFTTVYGGSPLPAPWVANTDVPFFNLPFTNTTGACINFEVINSTWQEDNNYQWFISLNAQDRTNGYIPGSTSFCASSIGVQLGIQQSGDKVQVLLRPDQNFNGALTGSTVTIRWATTAGVALNTAAAAFNNPAFTTTVGTLFHQGTFQQGGFSHAVFTTVYGGNTLPAPWVANTDVPFFNLPFTNTSGACVNFEVINSTWQEDNNYQWFISLNAQDRTNGYIPGSASFCAEPNALAVVARAILDGPWQEGTGLMRDALRTLPTFPLVHPYAAAPFGHTGTESVAPAILAVAGNNAVVDWVLLELRDASIPTTIVARRAALLQRDGDIVDIDGSSPVVMLIAPTGNHYLAVRHRNHLGTMTQAALATTAGTPLVVDFSLPSTSTFGSEARRDIAGTMLLWCGNAVTDQVVKYIGTNNDREPILNAVGVVDLNNTISGYFPTDLNLDGLVKYQGPDNDRERFLLRTLGGTDLNAFRNEQLP